MIAFRKINGVAHDVRCVAADYVPAQDETVIKGDELPAPGALDDPRSMARATADKLAEINTAFEAAAAQLTAGYPASEKLTWPIQEKEALGWRASSAAATPYIDAVALARGIDRVVHLNKVLANVDAFRAASAKLVGTRQKYVDQVNAAAKVAAIDALKPAFSL